MAVGVAADNARRYQEQEVQTHMRHWNNKRQHDNHPYNRPRHRAMRQTNPTKRVQQEAAPGEVVRRGGGEAPGNTTTNRTRVAGQKVVV